MNPFSVALVFAAILLVALKNYERDFGPAGLKLLNASYDPTRELYAELNPKFVEKYEKEAGERIGIRQSHGGSSRQARAVAEGLPADVVTLALPSDIEGLEKRGLVAAGWQKRFPNNSQPYCSTIVFVVRKTNPKQIRDWPDLRTPGIEIVTPDPKTSGNGKLSFLAAWGSVIQHGGTEEQARDFVTALYQHVTALGKGARDSATTFTLENVGDVHLTWENEAIREVAESKGELQVVYPSVSIRAEPSVAVVQAIAVPHQSEIAAQAYLSYLFTDEAQEIIARNGYRPLSETVSKRHRDQFPKIELFPVTLIARNWTDAAAKFFGENGIYSAIHPDTSP